MTDGSGIHGLEGVGSCVRLGYLRRSVLAWAQGFVARRPVGRRAQGGLEVSKGIKITDKRIFDAQGELRDEYRHLEDRPGAAGREPEPAPTEAGLSDPAPPPARPDEGSSPPLELPTLPSGAESATFHDLVALLAEPVALYLGDIMLPDGQSAENLEAARLYVDLLDVLRHKTAGNLSAEESSVLEDVLYRLKMRYVQKRG